MGKLTSKAPITEADILTLVKDPSLRHAVFRTLEAYHRNDLFPTFYFTHEKGAESFLVNWLEFPTELGTSPEEIELIKKVEFGAEEVLNYYAFKYRTKSPHWAAKFGWMIGVCGPYGPASKPYDSPSRVFSRFNTVDSISPETEVQWVHENIGQ